MRIMSRQPNFTLSSQDEAQTLSFARHFALLLRRGDLVCLEGELGAGTTTFVRGLALGLGNRSPIHSPTFALVHEYSGDIPIYHFDFYRLQGQNELHEIAFFDYLGMDGVVVIEWASRFVWHRPQEHFVVHLEWQGKDRNRRSITVERIPENRSGAWRKWMQEYKAGIDER